MCSHQWVLSPSQEQVQELKLGPAFCCPAWTTHSSHLPRCPLATCKAWPCLSHDHTHPDILSIWGGQDRTAGCTAH